MIDLVDEEQPEVPIEERLGVETLAVMIMNFNGRTSLSTKRWLVHLLARDPTLML